MISVTLAAPASEVTFRDEVYGFLRRRRHAPPHVHRCPVCYGVEVCGLDCAIEPDMELDNGTPCASFEVCSACERWIAARVVAYFGRAAYPVALDAPKKSSTRPLTVGHARPIVSE
ncbi:MAG: hypothetical protein ACM3O6_13225 [Acidobacteriota bacterium]